MKKSLLITIGVVLLIGIILYNLFVGTQRTLVVKEENVEKVWADVQSQYQRRADLIPNLVNTVKGYAAHEKETLTGVIEARAKATSVQINAENLTPEKIQQYQQAQDGLSSALARLLAVVESYPDLKANEQFTGLRDELSGTENRINLARRDFNASVNDYNSYLRQFPRNMLAGMFGFERKGYFQAQAGAENAPKVTF